MIAGGRQQALIMGGMFLLCLAMLLVAGCASAPEVTRGPDSNTEIFRQHFPDATSIHQRDNVIEALVGGHKVVTYVTSDTRELIVLRKAPVGVDYAEAAQVADVATSVLGITAGLAEANPLGAGIVPAKIVVNHYVETLPAQQCRQGKRVLLGFGSGAAVSNLLVISGITTGGIGLAVGSAVGAASALLYSGRSGCAQWMGRKVVF